MSLALEDADARLLVSSCTVLSKHPEKLSYVYEKLIPVALSNQLPFTTTTNLLRILLSYVSPVSVSPAQIAVIAGELLLSESSQAGMDETDLMEDVEDLLLWIEQQFNLDQAPTPSATLQIARDLLSSLAVKGKIFGFLLDASTKSSNEVLFSFIKAKTLQMSPFHHDLSVLDPLFRLMTDYDPFNKWFRGIILPYSYFWKNYVSVCDLDYATAEFLNYQTNYEQFDRLIEPLDSFNTLGKMMETLVYLLNVILPFLAYTGDGLQLLSSWMSKKACKTNLNLSVELWDKIIKCTMTYVNFYQEPFPQDAILELIRVYVMTSINQTIFLECNFSSINFVEAYSQMSSTTDEIVALLHAAKVSPVNLLQKIDPKLIQSADFKADFLEIKNSLQFFFDESASLALITLKQLSDTCVALYPMNSLTFGKYLYLKGFTTLDYDLREQEILKILSRIDENNYGKVLKSIDLFVSTFVGGDTPLIQEIDRLIIERFFDGNLFGLVLEYYQDKEKSFKISAVEILDLGIKKVWDLVRVASNIDERIGKMKIACECLDLLSVIATDDTIEQGRRGVISKFKHFQKALSQLKNFKLVLERNSHVTPQQILNLLGQQEDDEAPSAISLISLVLEQNPKSYLAYEKLYRISVDFSIFSGVEVTDNFLPTIQSACIESSLIDDNFSFAYKQSKIMFEYYVSRNQSEQLGKFWLTFYQVGKYILTDWFNDYDEKVNASKIDVLRKQREVLSLTLKLTRPSNSTVDNSRLIIAQLRHVNEEIRRWYIEDNTRRAETTQRAVRSTQTQVQSNIKEIINDVSASRTQASEKLSNLLVSGIGWAIGANREDI